MYLPRHATTLIDAPKSPCLRSTVIGQIQLNNRSQNPGRFLTRIGSIEARIIDSKSIIPQISIFLPHRRNTFAKQITPQNDPAFFSRYGF
jgi:hypothetical protein